MYIFILVLFFESGGVNIYINLSVLARQPSRAADSLLRSSRGGGWGPPLCIGIQEVGTYIYSRTYTAHGALGVLLRSITAANMVGEPVDSFRW